MNFKKLFLIGSFCTALASASTAGLVAHWRLDETSGTVAADASGAGIDGELTGSIAWGAGKVGNAAVFPGVSGDYIEFDSDALNLQGSLTLSVWAKYNDITNYGIFAGIDSSGGTANDQFVLKTASSGDGRIIFQVTGEGGSSATLHSTDTFKNLSEASADGWIHLVGVYQAGEFARLYVDGSLMAENTNVPAQLQSKIDVAPFKIGAMTTTATSYYLEGAVDDVQLYDYAISSTAVAELHAAPGTALEDPVSGASGRVAYWDFDEGTGTTATDSENDLIGTLTRSASWVDGVDGSALQIVNDDDSQLLLGAPDALNITGAVTVAAWVHPDGMSSYGVIAGIDQSGGASNDQYVLKTTGATSSYLSFQVTGAGGSAVSVSDTQSIVDRASASEDGWIHVAGVFLPGEELLLYIDGVEVAQKATSLETMQSTLSEAVPFRIGKMTESSGYGFNGAIDQVAIYNIGLEASELIQLADRDGMSSAEGTYLFSFGAVADPQYKDSDPAGSRYYRNSLTKLPVMVEDFNTRDLEFVICLGDFIDNYFESFEPMMKIWDDLLHPSYQVVGNHDLAVGSHTLEDVVEALKIPSNYYTFVVEGWRFFVLDGNDAGYGIHSAEQLAWLRDGLDAALENSEPVIIFDHYPVYPPGTAHISSQASELLTLLADYSNIRAWMNGHNHSGAYGQSGDIHFINLEGMVETADTTAYAEIEIWTDRIEVKGEGREPNRTLYFPQLANADLEVPADFSAGDGGAGVSLTWSALTDTEVESLEIQRRASGENAGYATVAILAADSISYLDTEVVSGVTYSYRIRSLTITDAFSEWSDLASVELGYLSGSILDLAANAEDTSSISLTWDLDSASYDNLILERRVGSGDYLVVSSALAGDATSYNDSGLAPNTSYSYRISGVSGGRQTEWSAEASAQTEAAEPIEGEAAGLVAYWPFDEGSGTSAGDFSGNGISGTLQASATWESVGHRNGAIRFSGNSEDQVLVGTPEALNLTGAVSVSAWVKPEGVSSYGVIAGIDQSGGAANDQYVLKTTHSNTQQLSFQVTAAGVGYTATDTVNLSVRSSEGSDGWVHVAGVFVPGESVLLYVNGQLVAERAVTIDTLQSTLSAERPFRIGNMSDSSDYGFNGLIDELRVFSASLSAEEVSAYANDETVPSELAPFVEKNAHWLYLDDGSDQGTDWTATDFDDSAWSTGTAEFGYGDGDEATVLSYGTDAANKHPTTYFRKAFELDSLAGIEGILIEVLRDDGVIIYLNGQELLRDNMPSGAVNYQTYASSALGGDDESTYFEFSVAADALVTGINVLAVELHNSDASSSDLSFNLQATVILESDNTPKVSESIITVGADWAYLDDGSDAGTAWRAAAFDDSTWAQGPAKFGYGDSNEVTTLSYGSDSNDKHITYYFRKAFVLEDLEGVRELEFGVLRDDGVIVYLNGIEIIRDNMPAGEISSETFSSSITDGAAESTFYEFSVATDALVEGENVLAVEIHNRDGFSSDIGFDLWMNLLSDLHPDAPVFESEHIETAHALAGSDYAASVAEYASDADGDTMYFAKVSGPDWLIVHADGSLSGTPSASHFGLNTFVISVTDNDEGTTTVILEIMVEEPAELARAAMPGSDLALRFAVIPDTQGSTLGVPTDEASAIARELIAQAPEFAIHVGDVTDGYSGGDAKLTELEYLKEVLATPLLENGIGFYPVRGNHDANAYLPTSEGEAAWQAAFSYLFEGEGAVVDPSDVPGGSEASPNPNNFSYVLDAGQDTYFVSLDLWNGGSSDNYSDWVAEKFAEIRAANPDAHIFGYSHPGLFSVASHPAMTEYVDSPQPYLEAGKASQVDGWFSGHNHIYDRSVAVSLDDGNQPYMFDFTCGSASEKFYSISRSPAEDQHLNCLIDSTTIAGRPIAYLLVEINGPFVWVQTYMSPDTDGHGTFDDWSVWDAYTYSRNGLQFTVASGENYNDRNIQDRAPLDDGFIGTSVEVVDGVNGDETVHSYGSTSFGQYRNITTGWWSRDDWYDAGESKVVSDIVSLNGMREAPGRNRCDAYTIKLSYDASRLSALEIQSLRIAAFLDADTADSDAGDWLPAVSATLELAAESPLMRAPTAEDSVGRWGIDLDNQQVWARLDYQGDFALITDVVDSDDDGLVDAWEMEQFGSLAYTASQDLDGDGLDNAAEQILGTNALMTDTDGDLFNDGAELAAGLDPLIADTELSDSVLDLIRTHSELQAAAGLYPLSALGGLNYGQTLIAPDAEGDLHFRIQLWSNDDLSSGDWIELGDAFERTIQMNTDKQFYKWAVEVD